MGLFGGPKLPPPPPPPPPPPAPPTIANPAMQQGIQSAEEAALSGAGFANTMLTGPQGAPGARVARPALKNPAGPTRSLLGG